MSPPHNPPTLIIDNTHRVIAHEYPDYPVGIRFVPHVPVPKPMFTGDELLWSCFFSGLGGAMITVGLAFVWSFL